MAAQPRIFQQPDTLKDLLDLLNDKDAVKRVGEVHDEIRKQNGLTEDDARKAAEARDFIVKYNQLSKDLKVTQDKLAENAAALEKEKADFATNSQNESERLASLAKALDDKASAQAETEKRHIEENKNIKAEKARRKEEYDQMLDKLSKKAATDDKLRLANEEEMKRIAVYRSKLEAKMAKFQEAAAI